MVYLEIFERHQAQHIERVFERGAKCSFENQGPLSMNFKALIDNRIEKLSSSVNEFQ
jgi:hypothetical protein